MTLLDEDAQRTGPTEVSDWRYDLRIGWYW